MIIKFNEFVLNESSIFDWDKLFSSSDVSKEDIQNINKGIFLKKLEDNGVKDSIAQANLLAQVQHESEYIPQEETANYSEGYLWRTFGKGNRRGNTELFKSIQDVRDTVRAGKETLLNRLYDTNKYLGNEKPGDGYRYRGRGFIQLTGKANYENIGKMINVDLVNNPDYALDPKYAFDIAIAYIEYKLKSLSKLKDIDTVCKSMGYAAGAAETSKRKRTASKLVQDIKQNKIKKIENVDDAIAYMSTLNAKELKLKFIKPDTTQPQDNTKTKKVLV